MYNIFDVVNFFINLSLDRDNFIDDNIAEGITHLKLQKLLYFAQAAHLSICNGSLFNDEIEAWRFGPVISSVYHRYKNKGNRILKLPSNYEDSIEDEKIKKFLCGVWELFHKYSTSELISITHNHKPWKDYYKEGINEIIPKEVLKEYYKNIFELRNDS